MKAVHRYSASVRRSDGGEPQCLMLLVRETDDGTFHYSLNRYVEENAWDDSAGTDGDATKAIVPALEGEAQDELNLFPLDEPFNPSTAQAVDIAALSERLERAGIARKVRFEELTGARDFKRFHREQAMAFKRTMLQSVNARTGEQLSNATMQATLRDLRAHWLAYVSGYKSHTAYAHTDYFNLSEKEVAVARVAREKRVPTLEQVERVLRLLPAESVLERRDRALIVFATITGAPGQRPRHLPAGAYRPRRRVCRAGCADRANEIRQDLPHLLHACERDGAGDRARVDRGTARRAPRRVSRSFVPGNRDGSR